MPYQVEPEIKRYKAKLSVTEFMAWISLGFRVKVIN